MKDLSGTSQTNLDGQISENTFEERREIVNFTEDDRVLTDAVTEITDLPSSLLAYGTEPREHTVKSFLQRPQKISTVTWSTSQVKLTNLVSIPVPAQLLTTMYREKLTGFGLLRADTVFKLQFNSQPFQAGRLIATYIPVPSYLVDRKAQCTATLCKLTALPNVIIDISKTTECNITLPYVSSFTHFDLTTGGGDWGQFDLWVYDPLSSASTQTVNISIRAYFDKIHLGAPTQKPLLAAGQFLENKGPLAQASSLGAAFERVQLQVGADKVVLTEQRVGPVSNIGHDIRRMVMPVLNAVGTHIPSLSGMVKLVGDTSMAALNAFAAFGFSKPNNLDKIAPRCLHAFSNFAQVDGIDNGHMLALRNDNSVTLLPGFAGSDVDEMSISYLMQTLQYYDTNTINTTQVPGTRVGYYKVTPFQNDQDLTFNVNEGGDPPQYSTFSQPNLQWFIASNFKYWRGSTILHLGLIKTDYHSLRLKIVYDPMATSPDDVTYSSSDYNYSVVVDFREKTDVYIELPFISPTPWKNVPPAARDTQTLVPPSQVELLSTFCGYVVIFIDNELQASSAVVSQTVNMITEFCASNSLHLGAPIGGRNWVPFSTLPASSNLRVELQANHFASDGVLKTRTSMQESTLDIQDIRGLRSQPPNDTINSYTTGDSCMSLRSLIKRFNWTHRLTGNQIMIPNQPIPIFYDTTSGRIIQGARTTYVQPTLFDIMSSLYAFRSGSIRFKAYDETSNQLSCYLHTDHLYQRPVNIGGFTNTTITSNTHVWEIDNAAVKGSGEFTVPYYHNAYAQVNAFYHQFIDTEPDTYFHFTQPQFAPVIVRSSTSSPLHIAKAAGEDYTLGFLLGVPFCAPSSVTAIEYGQQRPEPGF